MMEILVLGLNHRSAPVEVRERLAVPSSETPDLLRTVPSPEAVLLSTCNRVEIYTASEEGELSDTELARFLTGRLGPDAPVAAPLLYRHRGTDAVRHLFRVAAGLDAMVLGETQILAQVKEAYRIAHEAGRTGRILNPLFQRAFRTAKRIHSETAIGEKNVSVPSVAARLALQIFRHLSEKTLLVLGAGQTGELTVRSFRDQGVGAILIANRTLERADALAREVGGEAHDLTALPALLRRADIVLTCLSSEGFVLDRPILQTSLRDRMNNPVFLVDLSVPRNVHPDVARLDNVYLFNIDDLESIVNQNLLERAKELQRCEPILEEEIEAFFNEFPRTDLVEVLRALRSHVDAIGREELERTLNRLNGLSPEHRNEIEQMVHRLVAKVLHDPTSALREEAGNGNRFGLVELAKRLFNIK